MKKNIIISALPLLFIVLCFAFFTLPAVKGTTHYEEANGYQVIFGQVNIMQDYVMIPTSSNFFAKFTFGIFVVGGLLNVVSLIFAITNNKAFDVIFVAGLIAMIIFSFLYIFIGTYLPESKQSFGYGYYTYKPECGGGAIFTGIFGILISIVSLIVKFKVNCKI